MIHAYFAQSSSISQIGPLATEKAAFYTANKHSYNSIEWKNNIYVCNTNKGGFISNKNSKDCFIYNMKNQNSHFSLEYYNRMFYLL